MNGKIIGMVAGAVAAVSGVSFAESLTFMGTTEKNPLEYGLNETIKFSVTLVDKDNGNAPVAGKELRWTIAKDGSKATETGTATSTTEPLVITTSMSQPGFVRLTVNVYVNGVKLEGKTEKYDGGAGADIWNMTEWAEPADFASFWRDATNLLYTTAYTPVCTNFTPAGADGEVEYFLFDIPTFSGERHATGILAKPLSARAGECGIVAYMNGYGFGRTSLPSASVVKQGNIVLQIARHGEDPVNPNDAYYTDLENGEMKNFCFRNNGGTVQETDYYKMLMRDLRALQYAKSLPEWNGQTLKTTGGSMGGYQALGCAALDKDVTECSVSIPWSADFSSGVKYTRMTGWRPDWTATLDYVDLKNLAKLVTCPVTITAAGLGDYVCPPSGEILLYKSLPEPKKVTFNQNRGHDGEYGVQTANYVLQAPSSEPEPEPEPVIGRNLTWKGTGANKNWSTLGSWQDDVGKTNAVPRNGDTLYISGDPSGSCKNDIANLMPYQLKLSGYQTQSSSGEAIVFDASRCYGIYNTGYLHYDLPTKFIGTNVTLYSSSEMVCRNWFATGDGRPCGVRKIGTGNFHLNCSDSTVTSPASFDGFKYIEIVEGGLGLGFNGSSKVATCLPVGMVITFAASGTKILLRDRVVLKDLTLRETGTAVGKSHTFVSQTDGYQRAGTLEITGTPPDDVTTFSGTFTQVTGLKWAPDSAAKEFVLDGGVSTTTGGVEVANGTVRLKNGASFTSLKTLTVGATATLAIDDAPAKAFHADAFTLASGGRVVVPAGTTLTVGSMYYGPSRLSVGTYGAGGAAVEWILGGGSVKVESIAQATLIWVGGVTPRNWNNPNCWTNKITGTHEIPVSGDIIQLKNDANVGVNNNIAGLSLKQIRFGGGYQNPSGNEVTLRADSLGIYSDGYMFYNLPTAIEGRDLEFYTSQMTDFRAGGLHSYDGQPCGFRKTGTGQLGISPSGDWTGFKYITHTAGSLLFGGQGAGDMSLVPGLDVTLTGASLSIDVNKYCVLSNLTIRQTGSAVTGTHNIGARLGNGTLYPDAALEIAGTPELDTTEFSGQVNNPASFMWNPASADKTFVFTRKNGNSATTNTITVAKGTVRVANGGTFSALGKLALSGGTGTCFSLATLPSATFKVKVLELATGDERVDLCYKAVINADEAIVDGTPLAAGVYDSLGAFGTKVDWIAGMGVVCVGGVAGRVFPDEAAESVEMSWTANGGNDTSIGNCSNWGAAGSTTLPDFEAGSLVATFAKGTGAALDRKAVFKGINLGTPGNFSFTQASGMAFLGSGGITTAGTGVLYNWGWPVVLLRDQLWKFGTGDTIDLTSCVADVGGRLSIDGGTVNFRTSNTFIGPMSVTNAVIHAYADNALGIGTDTVDIDFKTSKLYLHGVTLDKTIRNSRKGTQASDASRGELVIAANTTNVINGDLDLASTEMNPSFGAGSVLRVKGNLKRGTTSWLYLGDNGTLILDKPVVIESGSALSMGTDKTIVFNAPDNNIGSVWFWLQGNNSTIKTTVPFAFNHNRKTYIRSTSKIGNFVWDLCGCDQGVTLWGMRQDSTTTITSEKPATLYLKHDVVSYDSGSVHESTNYTVWAGAAGVNFVGSKFFQLAGASTSTGIVQVTSGRLEFGANGSWEDATAAVIAGNGEMKFFNRKALGKNTRVEFAHESNGKMNLAYTGSMTVGSLVIDGEEWSRGTYGSPTSAARNKDERFVGNGILCIGEEGFYIMLR